MHEALERGDLPRLKIAYGYCCKPRNGIGFEQSGDPPATLDWDLWKGPAVIDQYHANRGSFISAVRAGDPEMANGNALDAHYGCVMGHLMNNSYRLGEKVPFNERAASFGDSPDAAGHFLKLHAVMQDGVGIPYSRQPKSIPTSATRTIVPLSHFRPPLSR